MFFHLRNHNTCLLVFPILPGVSPSPLERVSIGVDTTDLYKEKHDTKSITSVFACTHKHAAYLLRDLSRKQSSFMHEWVRFVHGLITSKYLMHVTNIYNR
jgi:hypothetical protein